MMSWPIPGASKLAITAIVWGTLCGLAWGRNPANSDLLPQGTPGAASLSHARSITPSRNLLRHDPEILRGHWIAYQCAVTSLAYGIPQGVLFAIATTESGLNNRPWPWTLDVDGTPYRYANRAQTVAATRRFLQEGHTRIDIGPMQVDWRYHGAMFPSLASVTHPFMNIAAAGRILAHLEAQTGNWWGAVARYHNDNPALGDPYMWHVYRVYCAQRQMAVRPNWQGASLTTGWGH